MERLKVGVIGLGLRGKSVLENVLVPICESGNIDITAICELSDEALLWGKNFASLYGKEYNILLNTFMGIVLTNGIFEALVGGIVGSAVTFALTNIKK